VFAQKSKEFLAGRLPLWASVTGCEDDYAGIEVYGRAFEPFRDPSWIRKVNGACEETALR
jgi:hypothetical protein